MRSIYVVAFFLGLFAPGVFVLATPKPVGAWPKPCGKQVVDGITCVVCQSLAGESVAVTCNWKDK